MLIKCTFLYLIQLINCQDMEPFIVGGQEADIEQYPHAVYMGSIYRRDSVAKPWRCGSSILNQWILLTAAHCFVCAFNLETLFSVGSAQIKKGFIAEAEKFIMHPNYKHSTQSHDIALVKTKRPLPLSRTASRVALMRNPPHNEMAMVSGWGLKDEVTRIFSNHLKYTWQRIFSRNECIRVLGKLPLGCICAGNRQGTSYASEGDSGSALMIRGFIQIGIVAYKMPYRSVSVTAYTDTGYFYDWIQTTSKELYCQ